MAQIKPFTADLTPDSTVPYGERRRRMPELGIQQAGQVLETGAAALARGAEAEQNYQTIRDSQAANKNAAVFRMQATQKLADMSQGGKFDDKAKDDYNEWLTQTGDNFRSQATTQRGLQVWDQHAANVYTDMGARANEVNIRVAGENAVNDANMHVQSDGLTLQTDPTQLTSVKAGIDAYVGGLPANIPIQKKQEIQLHMYSQAARNAGQGWIELNPMTAKDHINNDADISRFLQPQDREMLLDRSDTKQRAIESQQIKVREDNDRQWHITNQNVMNDSLIAMEKGQDKNGKPFDINSVEKLASQQDPKTGRPVLDPPQVNLLMTEMRRQAKEGKAVDDGDTVTKLAPRVYNNSASIDEVIQARVNGNLSNATYERYLKYTQDGGTVLKTMHGQALKNSELKFGIMPGAEFLATPQQLAAKNQYDRYLHEQEEQVRQSGGNATDVYLPGGAAEKGASALQVQGGVPTHQAQMEQLVKSQTPVQNPKTGEWIIFDSPDGTKFHKAGEAATGIAAPNATGAVSTPPQNEAALRAQQHSQNVSGITAGSRDELNNELANTYRDYSRAKPGPIRDQLYQKYNQLFEQWQKLPTRVQSMEEDAAENAKQGYK